MSSIDLVLLDLDNTLWDFEGNAEDALEQLFVRHNLHLSSGYNAKSFVELYKSVNLTYWKKYEKGEIDKELLRTERFKTTFTNMGLPESEHPENAWLEYLEICPLMTRLVPSALEFLKILRSKYRIGLVTNGFEQTQTVKIKSSGIDQFIDFMVTSEAVGSPKPNPLIFEHALRIAGSAAENCIYAGDTWDTDVVGGLNAGIRTYWFNPLHLVATAAVPQNPTLYMGQVSALEELGKSIMAL